MRFLLNFLLICSFLLLISSKNIVLPSKIQSSSAFALIFIQGANYSSDQYLLLLKQVQASSSSPLWIGISDCLGNIPDPLTISSQISGILKEMAAAGMKTPTKIFYAGHGLGGTVLSSQLKTQQTDGLILLGSFLPQNLREITIPEGQSKINFPSKVLTIANELDGLCRIMRMAEAFYHSIENVVKEGVNKYPVIVIKGASHLQFASGEPPKFVKSNDLKAEISLEEAHQRISQVMAAFIDAKNDLLAQKLSESQEFFKPLINSLKMEGSYRLKPPCSDDSTINRNVKYCGHGSEWVNQAQKYMAGFEDYNLRSVNLITDDNFHKVWTVVPDPLPSCSKNCTLGKACNLFCTSVTQLGYNTFDNMDTGFYPISADEMKTKMNSREALLTSAGLSNVNFTFTDQRSICKYINDKAIGWAFDNAGKEALGRFQKIGEKYVTAEDKNSMNGGIWIVDYLSYQEVSKNGETVVEVQSYTSRYPLDYWLPLSSGFHFCKLLSPARVMEWIYKDGLKLNGGL